MSLCRYWFISCMLIAGCGQGQIKSNKVSTDNFIKTVSAIEFKRLMENENGIILDVRTPQEVAQGQIPNASVINIYDSDFVQKINLMDKSKEIYVYCKAGGRSAQAAKILQENGFTKIYDLQNGFMAWEATGLPVEKSPDHKDENIKQISLSEFESLLQTDLPVLVDFHTVWCAPCRKMAPVIDKLEDEYKDKAKVMRVDVDKSKEVGKAYEVQGVPVLILYKKGNVVWRHIGIISESELKMQIEKLI